LTDIRLILVLSNFCWVVFSPNLSHFFVARSTSVLAVMTALAVFAPLVISASSLTVFIVARHRKILTTLCAELVTLHYKIRSGPTSTHIRLLLAIISQKIQFVKLFSLNKLVSQ